MLLKIFAFDCRTEKRPVGNPEADLMDDANPDAIAVAPDSSDVVADDR